MAGKQRSSGNGSRQPGLNQIATFLALLTYPWVNTTNLEAWCTEDRDRWWGRVLPCDVSGLLHRIAVVPGALDRSGVRALASAGVWPLEDLGPRFSERSFEVVRGKMRPAR